MQWFLSLNLTTQVALLYIVGVNIVTFFFFGIDKIKSRLNSRRVSEKGLWFLSFIGGSPGALVAMHFFRHKTKKSSFQLWLVLIILLQILLVLFFYRMEMV